jgi:hypothetical protein
MRKSCSFDSPSCSPSGARGEHTRKLTVGHRNDRRAKVSS